MEVFSVFATLSLADMISGPLGTIKQAMGGVTGMAGTLGSSMGKLALAMAPVAMVAAAVLGALGMLSTAGLATEKALGELATLGVKDLNAVEEAARQASNSMANLTKEQFITAAYDIKSGIASLSDEGVAAFTALAAKTAQATKATVADMTNLGATAYGIHKRMYASLTDENFGAMLYAGVASSVQAFKTTGAAMNSAMSNLGAAATQANRPLEEQLAVLGTLQNSMEASVAGTAYKSFFRDASKGFKELGIQAVDAHGQMRSMPDLLAALEKKLGTLNQAKLDSITKAFGSETGDMIQNLLGKSDELRTSIGTVGAAMKGGTSFLEEMASSVNAGLGPSLALLRQRSQNLAEELAKHLSPGVTVLTASLANFVLRMQEAAKNPFVGFVLRLVGGIAAAIVALTGLSAGIWFITNAAGMLGKALAPLKAALLGLGWPIWALIAAGAALYAAYQNNFGGIADIVNRWWRNITLVVNGVIAIFKNLTGSTSEIRGELATEIKAAGLENLVVTVAKVVYRIKEFFAGIGDSLNFDGAISALTPAILLVRDLFDTLGQAVGAVFGMEVKSAASEARSFGQAVGVGLSWALELLATVLTNVVRGVDTLVSLFRWCAAVINGDWATAAGMAQHIWDNLCASFMSFADFFRIGDWIRNAWTEASNWLSSINLYESGAKLLDTFKEGIMSRVDAVKESFSGALSNLRNLLPFSDAKEGPLSTLTLSGSRLMSTLGEGMSAGAPGLQKTLTGALGGVKDSIGNWWNGLWGKGDMPAPAAEGGLSPRIPAAPGAPDDVAEAQAARARQDGDRAAAPQSWTLHIGNITLPNVKDAQDFFNDLQAAATEYGEGMA